MIIVMMYSEESEAAASSIARPGERIHYMGNIPLKLDANSQDDILTLIDLSGDGQFQEGYMDGISLGEWLLRQGLSTNIKHIEIVASDNNKNCPLSVLAYKLLLFLHENGYDVAIHTTSVISGYSTLQYQKETKNWQLYEIPILLYHTLPPRKIPNVNDLPDKTSPMVIKDIRAWTRDNTRTCDSKTYLLPPLAP